MKNLLFCCFLYFFPLAFFLGLQILVATGLKTLGLNLKHVAAFVIRLGF